MHSSPKGGVAVKRFLTVALLLAVLSPLAFATGTGEVKAEAAAGAVSASS